MVFTLDLLSVLQLVLAVLLPIAVGLVTTRFTSGSVKAWLLAGLTLVTSIVTEAVEAMTAAATFDLGVALMAAIPSFAISVAMYYGLWKPTGVGEAAQEVEATTLFE